MYHINLWECIEGRLSFSFVVVIICILIRAGPLYSKLIFMFPIVASYTIYTFRLSLVFFHLLNSVI